MKSTTKITKKANPNNAHQTTAAPVAAAAPSAAAPTAPASVKDDLKDSKSGAKVAVVNAAANVIELTAGDKKSFLTSLLVDPAAAGKKEYAIMESKLLLHLDYLAGIDSKIVFDKKYPTGVALVRAVSSDAKRDPQPVPPDHPTLLAENMILRALNTMRGIQHVLEQTPNVEEKTIQSNVNKALNELIINAYAAAKIGGKDLLNRQNAKFNAVLVEALNTASLDKGLKDNDDIVKLLNHYRDLASALEPAKSMITTIHDAKNNVTHTETAHPITVKTEKQKQQLLQMKTVTTKDQKAEASHAAANAKTKPDKAKKDFQNQQKEAFQMANAAFYTLIIKDDRRLPAQTRKTVGPTIKNGYVVQNTIQFNEIKEAGQAMKETWSFRLGSPTHIGKEDPDNQSYTEENLKQLQLAIATMRYKNTKKPEDCKLHLTALVSRSPLMREQQGNIIVTTKKAIAKINEGLKKAIYWSNIPLNPEGYISALDESSLVKEIAKTLGKTIPSALGSRADRVYKAAFMSSLINESKEHGDVTRGAFCASGQDRTSTEQEAVIELWAAELYLDYLLKNKPSVVKSLLPNKTIDMLKPKERIELIRTAIIEPLRILGFHNAMLASLAAPGSTGMKSDSDAGFFSKAIAAYFYRKTANTNKSNPVVEDKISKDNLKEIFNAVCAELKPQPKIFNDEKTILIAFKTWVSAAIDYQSTKDPKSSGHLLGIFGGKSGLSTAQEIDLRKNITVKLTEILNTLQSNPDNLNFAAISKWMKGEKERIKNIAHKDKYTDKTMGTIFEQLEKIINLLPPELRNKHQATAAAGTNAKKSNSPK